MRWPGDTGRSPGHLKYGLADSPRRMFQQGRPVRDGQPAAPLYSSSDTPVRSYHHSGAWWNPLTFG